MLPSILSGIAVVMVLLVIFILTRPDEFRVERTGSIAAAPEVVFAYINDLDKFQEWSPWAKIDLNCKVTYEGPVAGEGASFRWLGNSKVGEGAMTITGSQPHGMVQCRLDFLKPFKATHAAKFTLKADGDQTALTWCLSGKNSILGKFISLFMNCEKMVGGQFQQGFANLNAVVAKQ